MNDLLARLLLVEDSEADIAAAMRILKRFPVLLQVARDGFEALDVLSPAFSSTAGTCDWAPQIILLDLSLPGMHGLDILRKLKNDPQTRHLVVIILTANREQTIAMECYRLRCDGVLTKPLTTNNVERMLARFGLESAVGRTTGRSV